MANIKSQKKRIITAEKARVRNRAVRSELKTAVKAVDQAVNKGLLHKNNAARKKSSMTLKLNKLA